MIFRFRNRTDAGQRLAEALRSYADCADCLVLALPRGGVPIGYEIALALRARLDVFLVRKLGVPSHEELAFGALASGGTRVLNDELIEYLGIPQEAIDEVTDRERRELERRELAYRDGRPAQDVAGRTVILVDDGLATGATMRAAAIALREQSPARLVVAVPVASEEARDEVSRQVDEIVCLMTPEPFQAVGLWYEDFPQVTDEEVRAALSQATAQRAPATGP